MTYEEMISSSPVVLVEFFATWCEHCQHMMPVVEKIKEATEGKVRVVQLDIDQNQALTQEMGVQGTPTFLLYKNGQLVWRQSGEMPESAIMGAIEDALA